MLNWLHFFILLVYGVSFLRLFGIVKPRTNLAVSSFLVGFSLVISIIITYVVIDRIMTIQNPRVWNTLNQIGQIVGLENIPYLLVAVNLVIVYELLFTPVKNMFRTPVPVAGYGGGSGRSMNSLTFGQPVVTSDVIVLDTVGKNAIKKVKKAQTRSTDTKKQKVSKIDLKKLKEDVGTLMSAPQTQQQVGNANVWGSPSTENINEYAVKKNAPRINPETLQEQLERKSEEQQKNDEINQILDSDYNVNLNQVTSVDEAVSIAFTSVMKYLGDNYHFPVDVVSDESRYRLLRQRKPSSDVWEFQIRFFIDALTYYDFAVYVDRYGRTAVNLINVM